MALHYDIDVTAARVLITGGGLLTMPEMIAVVDQVASDPHFASAFTVIMDIRDAHYTAELNDGNDFVSALKRREKDFQNRCALVVSKDLHVLGTLFCLLAKASGVDRMKCFVDFREAQAWCDWAAGVTPRKIVP